MYETFISPLYNFAFAELFGSQRNIDNTAGFLKTLLDIPEEDYDRLTVVNPVLNKVSRKGKEGVVDLRLETRSGRIIHIELQVKPKPEFRNRILYYLARLVGDQLRWGDDYGSLHQVISIVICDHNLLKDEGYYLNRYELRNEKNSSFTDMLKLVIIELPKLTGTQDSAVWPWLRFLKCERKEELKMLAEQHPELKKTVGLVRRMSLLESLRWHIMHRNLAKVDERQEKKYIEMEARKEALNEIARNLKADGFPLESIAKNTGLSLEEIQGL